MKSLPSVACYAAAATTLVSEAYGRKKEKEIRRIQKNVIGMMSLWFVVLAAGILFNSRHIIQFISEDRDVFEMAANCLPIALLIQIVTYGINVEKSVLQSVGHQAFALVVTFVVNILVLALTWFAAGELRGIYELLGLGYVLILGLLCWKDRRCIS